MSRRPPTWLVKRVLLGPKSVRRAAASRALGKQERWMLRQPDDVRESYAAEVLGVQPLDRPNRRPQTQT